MNVFLRELKAHRKTIIIWSIVMIFFVIAGFQKYSSMIGAANSTEEFMKLVDQMPKILQNMFGVSDFDITTPMGYFAILYSYLLIMAGIHAGMTGSNIIIKEERDKTAEFLMSKPISRNKILTSKIMAAAINIIVFNIIAIITSVIVLKGLTSNSIANKVFLTMLGMFLVQSIFMIIGIFIATIVRKPKKAGVITMVILLICFVLSMIVGMSDMFSFLSVLTPFSYFEAKDIMNSGSFNLSYILLTFTLIIIMLYLSYQNYRKRDLSL